MIQVKRVLVVTLIGAVVVMAAHKTIAKEVLAIPSGAAYETAHAATVPPAVIAANREQLAALVSSNTLGQNAPAIAATEAQYEEMWAQDVAAMVGYHGGASAAATQLTPFQSEQARHP